MSDALMQNRPIHSEAGWQKETLPRAIRPARAHPVRTLSFVAMIVGLGALLGISSAYLLIEREEPLDAIIVGPWKAYPKAGTTEADPYSVAIYTRGGYIPLASGEGLALTARFDSAGQFLDPACSYKISGRTPTARLWTLTSVNGHGRLVETLPGRSHISSQSLLRKPDGTFEVLVSKHIQAGNWLPLPPKAQSSDGLRFVLRLYDAPVTTGAALDGVSVPVIERTGCS